LFDLDQFLKRGVPARKKRAQKEEEEVMVTHPSII